MGTNSHSPRTDEYHYNMVQFIMILHTTLRSQQQNVYQTLTSQQTSHTMPSRASYGASIVRIWEKTDWVITVPHCTSGDKINRASWKSQAAKCNYHFISAAHHTHRPHRTLCRRKQGKRHNSSAGSSIGVEVNQSWDSVECDQKFFNPGKAHQAWDQVPCDIIDIVYYRSVHPLRSDF